ncbi:MAG: bile acid:sodium symporter family protein [Schleiferiaceae bacterium]|nr:bile acid:sodium symporter family protein [Schleiferiaceae bacterium]
MDDSAKIYLGIALMIVMMGMGLSLQVKDFLRVVKFPKAVVIGLTNQLLFLPFIAYLLIQVLDIRSTLAVGIMLIAACPGGPTSNLIAHLCKGDTALSVTLTALSSVLTLFTIPLILEWSLIHFMGQDETNILLNRFDIFKDLFIITILPISIGMLIKRFQPAIADKLQGAVKIASALVLLALIIGITIKERANIIPYFSEVGIGTFVLNVTTLLLGYLTATIFSLKRDQAISISIESGIQNGTLAIALALGLLKSNDFAIPAAVYSLIMFFTAFGIIFLMNRKARRSN